MSKMNINKKQSLRKKLDISPNKYKNLNGFNHQDNIAIKNQPLLRCQLSTISKT